MMKVLTAGALAMAMIVGCSSASKSSEDRSALREEGKVSVERFGRTDSSLPKFVHDAWGYAIFPEIGKGGLIVGGSYGRGVVYEQQQHIGYADMTSATIGLQAGGQSFSELIVFQDKAALDRFKQGKLKFAANVSAVILKSGAAESAKFTDGVVVFVEPLGGAMVEASIGGQSFSYVTKEEADAMSKD